MPSFRLTSRRAFLLSSLITLTVSSPGCGTLLYPERRGQPAGRLDWGVVLLNGIGLLLFFIPGVIAFAVDFSNGTIYLPPDEYYGANGPPRASRPKLREVSLTTTKPSVDELEAVLRREAGVDVNLRQREFVSQELTSVDDFWTAAADLQGRASDLPTIKGGHSKFPQG
jgi:hypothetical protein